MSTARALALVTRPSATSRRRAVKKASASADIASAGTRARGCVASQPPSHMLSGNSTRAKRGSDMSGSELTGIGERQRERQEDVRAVRRGQRPQHADRHERRREDEREEQHVVRRAHERRSRRLREVRVRALHREQLPDALERGDRAAPHAAEGAREVPAPQLLALERRREASPPASAR